MPRLTLPNFVFLQRTVNKANAFRMPARLNPSCCIIWHSLFCSKSFGKWEMWIAIFQRKLVLKERRLGGQDSENQWLQHWWFEGLAPCLTWSLTVLDTGHYLIGCHHLWARRRRDRLMINEKKGKTTFDQTQHVILCPIQTWTTAVMDLLQAAKDLLLRFQTQMGF